MGGLTIRGVLEEALSAGLFDWAGEVEREEEIEVAAGEMVVSMSADGILLLTIGTKTWRIEATEVTP